VYLTSSEALLSLHRSHGGGAEPARLESPLRRRMDLAAMAKNIDWATVRMRLIGSNPDAQSTASTCCPASQLPDGQRSAEMAYRCADICQSSFESGLFREWTWCYYGNQEGSSSMILWLLRRRTNQIEFDMRDQDRAPAFTGGELRLATKVGEVKLRAPLAYQGHWRPTKQWRRRMRMPVRGHIRFQGLGRYDKQLPLVIDPVLVYSAVFGGSNDDYLASMTVDHAGTVYLTGLTNFELTSHW